MLKILVVEDSEGLREAMVELLELLDYEVIGVEDGAAAMVWLQDHKPDFMITDFIMPKVNGLELVKQIRERGWDFKVIVVTGGAEVKGQNLEQMFADLNVLGIFDKPIESDVLFRLLEEQGSPS